MNSHFVGTQNGLFQDEVVTSDDLARNTVPVLRRAVKRPVSVVHERECFAILPRQDAATLIRSRAVMEAVIDALNALARAVAGEVISGPRAWVSEIPAQDRSAFALELTNAIAHPKKPEERLDEAEAVLYEWHSTVQVAKSGVLRGLITQSCEFAELSRPPGDAQLRRDIKRGLQDIEEGRFTDYSVSDLPVLAAEVMAQGRRLLAKKRRRAKS